MKKITLKSFLKLSAVAVLALGLIPSARAADKDPSGTWTWTTPGRNGGPDRKSTLTLKADGEKLTGSVKTPGRQGNEVETPIEEGKVKNGEVSFTVTREFNGNKFVSKYSGKVEGDSIKGKIEFDRNGQTNTRDWEAKKEK